MSFRCCAVVPTYDNPMTIRSVVERIRRVLPDVVVVDDGSHEAGRRACEALAHDGLAHVVHVPTNRGKGAALRRGFAFARSLGFDHAFQIDADGQHDLSCMADFLKAGADAPDAVIVAYPEYDETVPAIREAARKITRFWVDIEVGRKDLVRDAMIGFRIYPIEAALAVRATSNRMAYDVEVLVRMVRAGVRVVNRPVGVRYLTSEEGGLSHFEPFRDNVRMTWMHSRVVSGIVTRWCLDRLTGRERTAVG